MTKDDWLSLGSEWDRNKSVPEPEADRLWISWFWVITFWLVAGGIVVLALTK